MNDFMDIGGFVPVGDGQYMVERATGRIFKITEDGELELVEQDPRVDGEEDDYDRQN